jgi:hypothetical protein
MITKFSVFSFQFSALSCMVVLALAAGCGHAPHTESIVKLEGNVTIGGKPLPADAEGSIVFSPTARGEAPPVQAKIVAGHYKVENAPKGQVQATFNITRLTGKMIKNAADDVHPMAERINLVPEAARTGKSFAVQGDNLQMNFDL